MYFFRLFEMLRVPRNFLEHVQCFLGGICVENPYDYFKLSYRMFYVEKSISGDDYNHHTLIENLP